MILYNIRSVRGQIRTSVTPAFHGEELSLYSPGIVMPPDADKPDPQPIRTPR